MRAVWLATMTAGGLVVHADVVEVEAGTGEVGVDVAGDQAGAEESHAGRTWPAAAEPVCGQCRGRQSGGHRCLADTAFEAADADYLHLKNQYLTPVAGTGPAGSCVPRSRGVHAPPTSSSYVAAPPKPVLSGAGAADDG